MPDTPTPADAARRALVRLPDGSTGRLIFWPIPSADRHTPAKIRWRRAKVLVGGRHRMVIPEQVELVEP